MVVMNDLSFSKLDHNIKGIAALVLGIFIFSLQGVVIKTIGGHYPVLEIVLLRSLVAMPFTLMFYRMEGKRGLPQTKRMGMEMLRGATQFASYTFFFMGVATLPLATVSAINYSGPLMITLFSMFLGDRVKPSTMVALLIGFAGVFVVLRPQDSGLNIGAIFILLSTLTYAIGVILTRMLRSDDSSATMAYFSSLFYLAAALLLAPIVWAIGPREGVDPSLAFLLRPWAMPSLLHLSMMLGLGLVWASGMYFTARAYVLAKTSVVTPFEYTSLLFSTMWGFFIFGDVPAIATILGALLALASGLYILFTEHKQ